MMDDVAGSLTTLNQGAALADQQGDFDIKVISCTEFRPLNR
jgi:hypothetical protein